MKKKVLESIIEKYLVDRVESIGGKAYKFNSMGNKAIPDRSCYFPEGIHILVECKATGKKPTPLQRKVIRSLRLMGHEVLVLDSKELVNLFIETTKGEIQRKRRESK